MPGQDTRSWPSPAARRRLRRVAWAVVAIVATALITSAADTATCALVVGDIRQCVATTAEVPDTGGTERPQGG